MEKVKVCYFTRYIPHYRKDVFEELGKKTGIQFDIFASFKHEGGFSLIDPSSAINFKYFPSKTYEIKFGLLSLYYAPKFISIIIRGNYDVYITSYQKSNLSVWIGLLLCRLLNRKLLLWGHGTYKNKPEFIIKKIMLSLASGILFYDDKTKNQWLLRGEKECKLFVAHNSVNTISITEVIKQTTPEDIYQTKALYNATDTKNIVFVGRLQKRRNLDVLLDAISLIKDEGVKIKLFIIGDGPEKEHIQNIIKKREIEDSIVFLGELYDEKEIAKIFLSSICAVTTGWIGLFVQHAFCYGLPIIIGDNHVYYGPEAALVVNNVTGVICKNDNPKAFSNAILKMISDKNFINKLSVNAKNIILNKYNSNNMAKGFYTAINSLNQKL